MPPKSRRACGGLYHSVELYVGEPTELVGTNLDREGKLANGTPGMFRDVHTTGNEIDAV